MSPSRRTLLPLIAFFVSQSSCFQFTFPIPGKVDYKFAAGDIAVVEWAPTEVISQLALNCGPDLGIDSDTPAYTMLTSDLSSGVSYRIPHTWTDSYHKYCMFCTGTFIKACSGIFSFIESPKDSPPIVHALNGSTPQVQTVNPNTSSPTTTSSTTITITTQTTSETTLTVTTAPPAESTITSPTASSSTGPLTTAESSQVGSSTTDTSTTTCTTHLTPSPTQENASTTGLIVTTTSDLSTPTIISDAGAIPSSVCSLSTGASSCFPASSTVTPTFNFPSVVAPSATTARDSGGSSLRELQSTFACLIAIGVLASLCC